MKRTERRDCKYGALIKILITVGFAALLLILVMLRTDADISEKLSRTLSRGIVSGMGFVSSLVPFSLYETFLYLAIIFVLTFLVLGIVRLCKKRGWAAVSAFTSIALFAVIFGNVYFAAAGFNYKRETAAVPMFSGEVSEAEMTAAAEYFTEDFNRLLNSLPRDESGMVKSPYTHRELSDKLREEYRRLDSNPYFSGFTPRAKTIASSRIMSEMHIAGVFFAPFGEANVNSHTPDADMPCTMAHEMAHAKGVMEESEANLTAYYICLTSSDDYIRYSGYMNSYSYFIRAVGYYDKDKYKELIDSVDDRYRAELASIAEHWAQYKILNDIGEFFNDLYLKIMGVTEGTGSYRPPENVEYTPPKPGETTPPTIISYSFNEVQRMFYEIYDNRAEQNAVNA